MLRRLARNLLRVLFDNVDALALKLGDLALVKRHVREAIDVDRAGRRRELQPAAARRTLPSFLYESVLRSGSVRKRVFVPVMPLDLIRIDRKWRRDGEAARRLDALPFSEEPDEIFASESVGADVICH